MAEKRQVRARVLLFSAVIAAVIAAHGCALAPRNGTVIERRSDSFDAQLVYLVDEGPIGAVQRDDAFDVNVLAVVPGGDSALNLGCAGTGLSTALECPSADTLRSANVGITRFGLTFPPLISTLEREPPPRPMQPPVGPTAGTTAPAPTPPTAGTTAPAPLPTPRATDRDARTDISRDVRGAILATTTFDDVRVPDALWSPCDATCPDGARFFARLQFAVVDLIAQPDDVLPRVVNPAPFDASEATNACIAERFPSEGGAGVFANCRNPNQDHTRVFARN